MDGSNANGDGNGNNDDEEGSEDALSAEGPDEVVARDAAAANRWPDGGEAAHPVRRPPEPAALFREGDAHPGAPRPESNIDDDAASYRSFGTTGGTDGGQSSSQPADERLGVLHGTPEFPGKVVRPQSP